MVRLSTLVEYVIFKCHLTPSNQINCDIICRMVPPSPYYRYILSDICVPGTFSANCGQSAMLLTNSMSTGFHSGSVKLQITNCKFQITKEPRSPRAQCALGSYHLLITSPMTTFFRFVVQCAGTHSQLMHR